MNLRELQYLVAVDEERHFHRAAERCFVSQPTLSGQLKKLEEELGVQLVERNTRQVVMTEVGSVIAERARLILAETRTIREIAHSFQDSMSGNLQLGLIPTIAPYLLPIIMPVIRKTYPSLKLWLHEYQTAVLLEKLKRAELDLLILALPVDTSDFETQDLFREPFQLAAPRGEKIAKQSLITLTDIRGQQLMLLEEGHCLREHAMDVCLVAGASEEVGFQASSLETLRHMVAEGMGMTLMPELAVPARQRKTDSIVYIPFSDPKPTRRIAMVYRRNSYRQEVFHNLAELIRNAMPVNIFF